MFTILHTNDLHNHITPVKLAKLKDMRSKLGDRGALLDAGDAGGSGNITFKRAGEPILEEMSLAGYDAMTVGNRDFHVNALGFKSKLFRACFPLLCANIRETKPTHPEVESPDASDQHFKEYPIGCDERHPSVRSYVILKLSGGYKALVFGLTVPMVTERMWEKKLSDYLFEDPCKKTLQILPELKARFQPDLTIGLTHIGLQRDRILAQAVPGIDLIIGGHSHDTLPEGEVIGETLIAQAGSHGRFYGAIEIEFSPDSKKPIMRSKVFDL